MIVLEITDETGVTYYEVLALSPEDLAKMDEKEASITVQKAAKKVKRPYNQKAQKGDKEAEEKMAKVNEALSWLKNVKKREEYNKKELESGKGASLEVLRIQRIAPPFFWDRNVCFRVIGRLMREAGMTKPIPVGFDL